MNSTHFEHLETPCGCLMAEEASRESDETLAEVRRMDGARVKKAWRCPDLKEFPPPDDDEEYPAELPEGADPDDHRRTLTSVKQVQTMTGVRCATCPWWYTARPWVIEASEAAWLIADGGAALVADEITTAPKREAIRLVRASYAAEAAYTRKRKEQEQQ